VHVNTCVKNCFVLVLLYVGGGVGVTRPFPRDGGAEEFFGDTNSRATPQGLDQKSKMEEVVPKMARRRGSDTDNPEGGELVPKFLQMTSVSATKRILLPFYPAYTVDKRTKEGCDRSSSRDVHNGQDGEDNFMFVTIVYSS